MRRRPSTELTRREIVAQRRAQQAALQEMSEPFQANRTLQTRRPREAATPSERQALWRLKARRRKLMLWLCGSVLLAGLSLGLLSQLTARIHVVTTDAAINTTRYSTVLEEYFGQRPIERLRFLVDEAALHTFFTERTPEVKTVRLVSGYELGASTLQLSFRQPVAQWNAAAPYFVDENGVTFEKNYFTTPAIVVKDESGIPTTSGQEVINRRFLGFLGQAVALFRDHGMTVTEAVLPHDTVRQVRFTVQGRPYSVIMTIDRTAEAQVTEALHAMRHLDTQGKRPQYIDVRVNRQVFYK